MESGLEEKPLTRSLCERSWAVNRYLHWWTYHRDSIEINRLLKKNAGWNNLPALCIAASSIAAVRGAGVLPARPRLPTRTQCTIRAPARDRELHAGSGSRKRSGVACGSGICRTMSRSPPRPIERAVHWGRKLRFRATFVRNMTLAAIVAESSDLCAKTL